jgi:hypothetical protein
MPHYSKCNLLVPINTRHATPHIAICILASNTTVAKQRPWERGDVLLLARQALLLLGCHALRGRERDAAKDDLPASTLIYQRLRELAGKSVLGYI